MKINYFKELAQREKGTFYFKDEDISIGMGVRSPHVIYRVEFLYKKNPFIIENRTGTAYVATVTCRFNSTLHPLKFSVVSISNFKNLFWRKENRLMVKTQHANFQFFIENNSSFKKLNDIAREHNFTPYIECDNEPISQILTTYHLEFDDWTAPVDVLIRFYKDIIDELEKERLNVSKSAYRDMQ